MLLSLVSISMNGQSLNHNYILTEQMLDETGTRSVKSMQYYDGLGRSSILAMGGVNTNGNYVYSMTEYDMLGRESKIWQPCVGTQTPNIVSVDNMMAMSRNTYNDNNAYSEIQYDAIGQPIFRTTSGEKWKGKGIKTEYITNGYSNAIRIKRYRIDSKGNPTFNNEYYTDCTLEGERTTDEDGHKIEVYKDIFGHVVLERRDGSNDTYYVYDRGLLRVVIPPLYQKEPKTSLLYKYKYDAHGRCIEKTLPGCSAIKYWYDKYGRMAFMQDGRMKSKSKYRFFLYDGLSRLVIQGLCSSGANTADTLLAAKVVYGEGTGTNVANTNYFVASSYILTSPQIEIVNYYDGYDCLNTKAFSTVKPKISLNQNICTTTLQTAQLVATSDGGMIARVMQYDEKGRVVDMYSSLPDKSSLKTHTCYSFTDKPTLSTTRLTYQGSDLYVVRDSIKYDKTCNLPIKELISINGQDYVTVSENEYDGLGRLIGRKAWDGSIHENFAYDVHGWQTSHCVYDSNIDYVPVFQESLYYASGPGEKYYNGNISSVIYGSYTDRGNANGFRYKYDGLDRLVEANYSEGWDLEETPKISYTEKMEYNANSAITSLQRWAKNHTGSEAMVDNMTYKYNGNRIQYIKDTGASNYLEGAFDHKGDLYTYYYYDDCGSIKSDPSKGINNIEYDVNGMPSFVKFDDGSETEYLYTSDGIKLKTIHRTAVPGIEPERDMPRLTSNQILSVDSIMYLGRFEFVNSRYNNKNKYYFTNGYVSLQDGNHMKYNFFASDHLGNNRAVISRTNYGNDSKVEQVTNYYAYGGIITDYSIGEDVQSHKYNGKELDRMHGLDWYDYSARQYDATIGQFTSMDPLCEKYYHISPYTYCAGNPVKYVDPDGRLIVLFDGYGQEWRYDPQQRTFLPTIDNPYRDSNEDFINQVTKCLRFLSSGEAGNKLVSDLSERKARVAIMSTNEESGEHARFSLTDDGIKSVIRFNLDQVVCGVSGAIVLGHELAHSQDRLNGTMLEDFWFAGDKKDVTIAERYSMHWENLIRAEHGETLRQYYTDPQDGYPQGCVYNLKNEGCVSKYFDSKYPYNVNYKNELQNGKKGYVYKSF